MRALIQKQNRSQQRVLSNITRSSTAAPAASHHSYPMLHLQRTIGNKAVQRLLEPAEPDDLEARSSTKEVTPFAYHFSQIPVHAKAPASVQTKLTVSSPGNIYEQEADRASGQVMSMSAPQLQRTCACGGECPKCQTEHSGQEHERLQTKRVGSSNLGQTAVPPIVHEVLRSPGQPLDMVPRAFMESRFGQDFSRVQVHADARAAESAQAVNALAYTAGRHLVFGAGHYSPTTASGRRLLAHELAHSVQQGFTANPFPQLVGNPRTALERQADEAADGVIKNVSLRSVGNIISTAPTVQTRLLQREEALSIELNLPPSEEKINVRQTSTARETVPPVCRENSLVLSWEEDTCCSNRGFPDPAAKNKTTGADCCNVFPRFVDNEATNRGFDGAASCKPKYIGHSATVTPNDKSKSAVKVICTDTRANNNNVIELGEKAAIKAYGNANLRERAKACYADSKEPGTCYVETDCNKTINPKESQCLPADCSKTDAAGSTKKQDKPKK